MAVRVGKLYRIKAEEAEREPWFVMALTSVDRAVERSQAGVVSIVSRRAEQRYSHLRRLERDKGTWYAVAELSVLMPDSDTSRVNVLEYIECKRKRDAVDRARELLKKHADKFSEHSRVEVDLGRQRNGSWSTTASQPRVRRRSRGLIEVCPHGVRITGSGRSGNSESARLGA